MNLIFEEVWVRKDPYSRLMLRIREGERHYIVFGLEADRWMLRSKMLPAWIEEVIPQIQQAIDTQV